MKATGWRTGLQVTADGTGIVSHAGAALVRALADFTDEQRKATIAGWQTFFDVLQQIAETA